MPLLEWRLISAYSLGLCCAVLRHVRTLRKDATAAEFHLWKHLRRRQMDGFKFRRQHPVEPYICDFVCLEARLVVEVDGSQHAEATIYDARRDDFLRSNGFRVLRFWNGDVVLQTASVLETIFAALHRRELDGRFG